MMQDLVLPDGDPFITFPSALYQQLAWRGEDRYKQSVLLCIYTAY
jgi:hypothetical protein